VAFRPVAGGLAVSGQLCLNGQVVSVDGAVEVTGPGRLAVPGMADWWVLWVDSGYRTLALGTPDGRFGFVLDRGRIGPDRLAAAAEIFDFNGYSRARLMPF
jgi:apolipoprotein D and lipocalin family protein